MIAYFFHNNNNDNTWVISEGYSVILREVVLVLPFTASHYPARDILVPLTEIYCTYHLNVRPPPGFCHCWSVRLEQSSGPCPQSELHRSCFQALAEDISVRTVPAHLAPVMRSTHIRIGIDIASTCFEPGSRKFLLVLTCIY